jgi:CHASE3 domain sensor protein
MHKLAARVIDLAFIMLLAFVIVVPQDVFAQNHVVSPSQLQRDVASVSADRQQNINQVEQLLASPGGREALESRHIDYKQVRNAVPELNNQELARLAKMSNDANQRFAAGDITNRDLLWILVAVAVIILIVVAK